MAVPEVMNDITFKPGHGKLFAYNGNVLIGEVSSVDDGVHVKLIGKKFRVHRPPDERAMAIRDLADRITAFHATMREYIRSLVDAADPPPRPKKH